MNIEKYLPTKELNEKMAITLEEVLQQLHSIPKEDLKNTLEERPREYIVKKPFKVTTIKELRKMGVEFAISGEKDRFVLTTGSLNKVDNDNIPRYIRSNRDFPYANNRALYLEYFVHSHAVEEDFGNIPGLGDLQVLADSRKDHSLLFTREGVQVYTWKHENKNVGALLQIFMEKKGIYSPSTYNAMGIEEKYKLIKEFETEIEVITNVIPWENETAAQEAVDNYFK